MSESYWNGRSVLVTGGASFIGSHLVDKLVKLGAIVTVVDNLSSGSLENLSESINAIRFVHKDLEYVNRDEALSLFKGQDTVFHLAAIHGGRGFIQMHPADVCSNLAIDHKVFEACHLANVGKVVYASSACVYPPRLQTLSSKHLLMEEYSNPFTLDQPLSADVEYGWCKLMGEIQLISFRKQYGLEGSILRFVTAYGPRENETHAIIALIYKAVNKMDPYVIWGSGEQERDFTYVEDIVDGTLLAAEKISDMTPINLGTGKTYKLKEVAYSIFNILGWHPKQIEFDLSKPVGVESRALDITRARQVLGWEPKFDLEEGLRNTIEWYVATRKSNGRMDEAKLYERSIE